MASFAPTPPIAEAATGLLRALSAAASAATDVLMPPTCVSCKAPVASAHLHCADCWATLLPPPGTRCAVCSVPLPEQWAAETICLGCLRDPPPFRRAWAPFRYADAARGTVLAFKNGAEHLAPLMARAMLASAPGLGPGGNPAGALFIPVPLHRWRLLRRGYNQAALLARAAAGQAGADLLVDGLVRIRPTRQTRSLGRAARAREMAGAFRVPAARRAHVAGAHVILIDDVLTTGATASACARALRRAGAAKVDVLTYARVAGDHAAAYAPPTGKEGSNGPG